MQTDMLELLFVRRSTALCEVHKPLDLAGRGPRMLSEHAVDPRYHFLSALGRNVPR